MLPTAAAAPPDGDHAGEDRERDFAGRHRPEVEADLLYRRYFYRSATSETMRTDLRNVVDLEAGY